MKATIKWAIAIIGWLSGTLALSNFVLHAFGVSIGSSAYQILTYYRHITSPFLALFERPLVAMIRSFGIDWIVPQWFRDLHMLSFIGGAIVYRYHVDTFSIEEDGPGFPVGMAISGWLIGLTGLGLLYYLRSSNDIGYYIGYWIQNLKTGIVTPPATREFEKYFSGRAALAIIAGLIGFFIINAST